MLERFDSDGRGSGHDGGALSGVPADLYAVCQPRAMLANPSKGQLTCSHPIPRETTPADPTLQRGTFGYCPTRAATA